MSTLVQSDLVMRGEVPLPKEVPTTGVTWPRMLVLDEETESRLTQFLDYELQLCFAERETLVQDWMQWQTDYWAKPEAKEKNFPFKRAANIVIPITAIAVEAIYARIMNTLFSVEPFWSIRPKLPEWVDAAPSVESWLQSEAVGPLNVYGFTASAVMELVKLGTAVAKSGYTRDVRKSVTTLKVGNTEREVERFVELYNGATLDHVPLANFIMRLHEQDPQKATWVGEEHVFTWAQLKRMVLSGQYRQEAVDAIKNYWQMGNVPPAAAAEYTDKVRELSDTEPTWRDEYRIQEIWMSFDVDGDGVDEEIVVDFHRPSRTCLAYRYNWYDDLHRPYRVGQYIPVEGRLYGIGVGKQGEQFQKVVTTIHRQRLDNATLANMMQLALKKTSGYGPSEPLFPGKIWFLDDPQKDIQQIQMADIYNVTINNEEYAGRYFDKYSGASDMILGVQQQGTPGTATSDLARLAEGNKKFDLVLKNIRHWLGPVGVDVLSNYQQFGDQQRHWMIEGPENGQYVEQILQMPSILVRQGALIELTVTDSITNKEVQRQEWIGLFTVLTQYYDKQKATAFEVAQLTRDPQFAQIAVALAAAALKAGDYAIKRVVETYKEANLDIKELLLMPNMEAYLAQMGSGGAGAAEGSGGAGQATGMGQFFANTGAGGLGAGQSNPISNGQPVGMGTDQGTSGV